MPAFCVVSTIAGNGTAASVDGTGIAASFNRPHGLFVASERLYVLDNNGHRVRTIRSTGVVTTLAGSASTTPFADGTGAAATFLSPSFILQRSDGSFLICDQGNRRIRLMTPAGAVSTLAGTGVDGTANAGSAASATFSSPKYLALHPSLSGPVYISDISACNIRAMASATGGAVTTYAGPLTTACGSTEGIGTNARFGAPYGMAVAPDSTLWVVEGWPYHRVRTVKPSVASNFVTEGRVEHLAGSLSQVGGTADGTGAAATFNGPQTIVFDPASAGGLAFVAEYANIRTLTPAGVVGTLAGSGSAGSSNGACLSQARFTNTNGLTIDPVGNLFTTEWDTNLVRKVTRFTPSPSPQASPTTSSTRSATQSPVGSSTPTISPTATVPPYCVVSTYAGTGEAANLDAPRASAKFNRPHGVAFVGSTLYVTDSEGCRIRAISPLGMVTTVAGDGTFNFADGEGTNARFNYPTALVARSDGVLLIADNSPRIRTMTPAGVVSTLAGSGMDGSDDNSNPLLATFAINGGRAIALSAGTGPLYFGDKINCNIRAMASATGGAVTTYAGSAARACDSNGGVDAIGTNARFGSQIYGLAVSPLDGSLWVADGGNHRIRRITPSSDPNNYVTLGAVAHLAGSTTGVSGYANGGGTAARFNSPLALQFDPLSSTGDAIVVELYGVRTVTPAGVVGSLAGNSAAGASNGACLMQASFNAALAVTADSEGNLYIAEWGEPAGITSSRVRKVTRVEP